MGSALSKKKGNILLADIFVSIVNL